MVSLTMIPFACGSDCPPKSSSAASCAISLLEIAQNNNHRWIFYVARHLIWSHVSPFDSFAVCILIYYLEAVCTNHCIHKTNAL